MRGALTQRTGGSIQACGGVGVAGLMEGSGVRSEGGISSGLEDLDLSTGFKPVETRDMSNAGLECPCNWEASLEAVVRSLAWDWACGSGLALDSFGILCAGVSVPSVGNCPPRCIRM